MSFSDALKKEDNLFWEAVAASIVLHFLIFRAGELTTFPKSTRWRSTSPTWGTWG